MAQNARDRVCSNGWTGHLMALLSGLIYPLGFAPFEFWPATLLSALAWLALIQQLTPRQALLRSWFYGLGVYGAGVSWVFVSIHQHGHAPAPLAALLTLIFISGIALCTLLQGYLYRRFVPDNHLGIALGFPAAWVLAEWFRSWFLTGFPWLYLGYAPLDSWLGGWAPLTGVYGLSFWMAMVASTLYLWLRQPRWQPRRLGVLMLPLVLPFLLGAALMQIQWTRPLAGEPLRVALIQGNIPQPLKWNPTYASNIMATYDKLTRSQLDNDLIIWPETAIPLLYRQARILMTPLIEKLDREQVALISGVPTRYENSGSDRYHNSIVALGAASGIYHKQRLVPFGEYVPLESILRGLIEFFDLPMSAFTLGPRDQPPLRLRQGISISPFICYEIAYPDLVADNGRGSDLLLTISNDSWFGNSLAPHQHQQMARMRALENGRYLLRGTNNGISSIIDPQGKLLKTSAQFNRTTLEGEVRAMEGITPFARFGSTPVLILCALALLLINCLGARSPLCTKPSEH
jgi:apolipoprotein N-acyltransferase